jgi:hypothetical protein
MTIYYTLHRTNGNHLWLPRQFIFLAKFSNVSVNYLKKTSKQSKTNNKQKQQQKRIISQDKCSKLKRIQPLTKSGFSDITEICNYFIS